MIGLIVLAILSVPSIGFMLYALVGLQGAIRREQRDRLNAAVFMNRKQDIASITSLVDDTTHQASASNVYKAHEIRPIQNELSGISFDLQPLRKRSSGGSR